MKAAAGAFPAAKARLAEKVADALPRGIWRREGHRQYSVPGGKHDGPYVLPLGDAAAMPTIVVGGTFQSLAPGEDTHFLLASLVVVIVGGMGSIPARRSAPSSSGCAEQLGSVYIPDLRHCLDLRDHGARARPAAAGPVGRTLNGAAATTHLLRSARRRTRRRALRIVSGAPRFCSSRPRCSS